MPTNPYYQEAFQGQPGQTAKAEQVTSEYLGVQAGFDAVYLVNQHNLGVPTTDPALNLLPAAGVRASQWLKFDTNGQPIAVPSPLNPRGAWQPSTVYNVGDAYTAAPNNSLYYVKTGYTSGATFGSTDTTNTLVIVNLASLYFTTPVLEVAGGGGLTFTAAAGNNYGLDSSAGNITVNLPVATFGDSPISFTYLGGAASTVTINAGSGQFINGNTQTVLTMDITGFMTTLQYWGATYGWRIRTMG